MKRDEYKLFSPGKIAHLSIKNRLIRAATYEGAMTEEGRITPLLEVKSKPLKCVLKQNRLKQKIVKNLVTHIWKLIVK